MYYINNFIFFSLFGHLLESTIYLFLNNNNYSGIMYGPWTPVYGLGVIIIIIIYNIIKKTKLTKFKKIILITIINIIFLTII